MAWSGIAASTRATRGFMRNSGAKLGNYLRMKYEGVGRLAEMDRPF
jgi:hypothetical protein